MPPKGNKPNKKAAANNTNPAASFKYDENIEEEDDSCYDFADVFEKAFFEHQHKKTLELNAEYWR